ncbi:MAG: biotin-dependent carboxyltransferase family protein [Corynebacterium sp.]|nr:biotin-dependent carboxyltransferase family protein [Corynebacterium sp.]
MLRVIQPAALMLVQDAGRFEHMSQGIPVAGAFDLGAFGRANRLVGNAPDGPVLEILGGNAVFEAEESGYVTITGFSAPVTIGSSHFYTNELLFIKQGERLELGMPVDGARGYLAIRGGIATKPILGSASRDILSDIGPEPLAKDDVLTAGEWAVEWSPSVSTVPNYSASTTGLAAVLGPRDDWFEVEDLFNQEFTVEAASNRIGIRLKAEHPIHYKELHSLPSEGIVRGSIQVPPDGNPVIFGPDHPITGGYPVIAVLTPESCDLSAQLLPGEKIHFIKFCT